jgi:hypothetical protein
VDTRSSSSIVELSSFADFCVTFKIDRLQREFRKINLQQTYMGWVGMIRRKAIEMKARAHEGFDYGTGTR